MGTTLDSLLKVNGKRIDPKFKLLQDEYTTLHERYLSIRSDVVDDLKQKKI